MGPEVEEEATAAKAEAEAEEEEEEVHGETGQSTLLGGLCKHNYWISVLRSHIHP